MRTEKRKLWSVWCVALAVTAALLFGFGFGGTRAQAATRTNIELVTTVDVATYPDAFTIDDGTLTKFNVPDAVSGYFKVVVPAAVTGIAAGAFDGGSPEEDTPTAAQQRMAQHFVGIEIPSSVAAAQVEAGAFRGCGNLVEVCSGLESSVAESGLYDSALSRITDPADTSLRTRTSSNNANYLFVRVGGVASTVWSLIAYDGSEKNIELPAPGFCDAKCASYSVRAHAFENREIASLTVPAGVTQIGAYAFAGCGIQTLTLSEGLRQIDAYAFDNAAISALTVPASVAAVKEFAFAGCSRLTDLTFAKRTEKSELGHHSFADCVALKTLRLPDKCDVLQYAFDGCSTLMWVYAGEETHFTNTAASQLPGATFFPRNRNLRIIFPSKAAYDAMEAQTETTFKNNHGDVSTYIVNVNRYIGDNTLPVTDKRLYGENYDYVCNDTTGEWGTDTAYASLPAQAAHYASTVWYNEKELTSTADIAAVNAKLHAAGQSEINLFCFETIEAPALPAEPASWVYSSKISYDIADLPQVLEALGCTDSFNEKQLGALAFSVQYVDTDGKPGATPSAIHEDGVYSVTVTLDERYGVWTKPTASTVTVNVNTSSFNVVMIVLLVVGVLLVAATIATVIIRRRVLAKARRKQLSKEEVLEKFRALGEETTLK